MFGFKRHLLTEKLITLSNGKKYGQIVFLAGGAGSGKGFAADNFMQKELFKVRDVDEWKKTFQKISKLQNKYPEIKGLDLTKSDDVFKLHIFIKKLGIKDKTLDVMLSQIENKETLPNIMFDITAKDLGDIKQFLPRLLNAGYNPANIHLVWVLTDYEIAIEQNKDKSRGRVVPDDIMLTTHKGAANTVFQYVNGYSKKLPLNGEIHVILNNKINTVYFKPTGADNTSKISNKKNSAVVKDFTYITLKNRGKPIKKESQWQKTLHTWIMNSIPQGDLKAHLKGIT